MLYGGQREKMRFPERERQEKNKSWVFHIPDYLFNLWQLFIRRNFSYLGVTRISGWQKSGQ